MALYVIKRTSDRETIGWSKTKEEAEEWVKQHSSINSNEYFVYELIPVYGIEAERILQTFTGDTNDSLS